MKIKRKIIEINEELCNGCGECVPSCAEGAIQVIDGKARLVAEKYCDGLGACLGECPTDALRVVEREAEDFDELAVEEHLTASRPAPVQEAPAMACGCPSSQIQSFAKPVAREAAPPAAEGPVMACGCPSTQMQSFAKPTTCEEANRPVSQARGVSALTHWPVQIKLVPPTAPFLKGADLLVAADCTPFAYPDFHRDFLQGKVLMVGCPKFDDAEAYIQKFTDIFKMSGVKSVNVVTMEVPCCQGLPVIVKRGMAAAGADIPMTHTVVSLRGDVIRRE